jgi:hypothetical protein
MGDIDDILQEIGDPIVVATHPRSGTHLTIDLLRKQFESCKGWVWPWETLHHLYVNLDRIRPKSSHPLTVEEAIAIMQRPDRPTLKTHSCPAFNDHPAQARKFARRLVDTGTVLYIVRDGRDVLCSAYLWEQSHTEIRSGLSSFLRGPTSETSRVKQWATHVETWCSRNDVHVIRFEDILAEPRAVIERLGQILELSPLYETPYLPNRIENDSRLADYWRRLRGDHESTTIVARPNGESPPDWREAFTEEDRQFFAEEAGAIMEKFGYRLSPTFR